MSHLPTLKKVSLTGPESAGKSTLAAQLAAYYRTAFVPEYARQYLEENGATYRLPDLEAIAHGQLAAEDAAAASAAGLLVCDTDLLVLKIWTENAFGTCPAWILAELQRPRYALTLLLAPDLPWTPDPLREHPDPVQRWQFYHLYLAELQSRRWPFVEINGPTEQRLAQAIAAVDTLGIASAAERNAAPAMTNDYSPFLRLPPKMPTLTSSTARVEIATLGAELTSFVNLITGLEYVWQADPAYWGRHAPLLFPIVGRLPEDTYLHNGQAYKLPQHGFARDQEFKLIRQEAESLTLQLMHSAATQAMYPFEFELRVRYELHGSTLRVGWHVRNPAAASQELLFSIGAHPAFRCPLRPESGEQFTDYALHFDHPVTVQRQLLLSGLRSGETAPVLTQQAALPLSYELFADDALVFGHFDFTRITLQKTSGSGPSVRMQFDGFPYLGLWTKGPGAAFVCIEPWQGVASPAGPVQELRDKEGILTLEPGQAFETSYSIEIG